jgi:hypothetical protein
MSSFGNPRSNEVICAVDLRERIRGRNPWTSDEITSGENKCGEVETPEVRRAEVIYSRRSAEYTRVNRFFVVREN